MKKQSAPKAERAILECRCGARHVLAASGGDGPGLSEALQESGWEPAAVASRRGAALAATCPECLTKARAPRPPARSSSSRPFYGPLPFRPVRYRASHPHVFAAELGVERRLPFGTLGTTEPTTEDVAHAVLLDFLGFPPAAVIRQAFGRVLEQLHAPWNLEAPRLRLELRTIGESLSVSCLRCLDDRQILEGAVRRPCPVCNSVQDLDAPVSDEQ